MISISNFVLELLILRFFSAVKKYNPWGGMTNNGMKKNVNSQADAEIHLKYLDGDSYTHIPGLTYSFDDKEINPFRIREANNGDLRLSDHATNMRHEILCQYDCQGNGKDKARNSKVREGLMAVIFDKLLRLSFFRKQEKLFLQ